jgi:hypothetical protein
MTRLAFAHDKTPQNGVLCRVATSGFRLAVGLGGR